MAEFDPWKETPRKSIIVLLLSIFSFFTTIGFANDVIALGYEEPLRFVLGVILSGVFAVLYAVGGTRMRKKWWKAVIPICIVQFLVMGYTANRFPDRPIPSTIDAIELHRLHIRFIWDSAAIIAAVSLGYGGFFHVAVNEARRYVKTRTDNILYANEMTAARQIQQVILPDPNQIFPGFAVESVYKPAREVGGDFFQILPVDTSNLLVVIGDVAGKGLPAAMLVTANRFHPCDR